MANTYLSATLGTATNRKKWTYSAWVKKSRPFASIDEQIFGSYADATTSYYSRIADNGSKKFEFTEYNGSGYSINLRPTNLQVDTHGWYHIVVAYDSTQATASDRVNIYINGEIVTSWSQETYPSLNYESGINKNQLHTIGKETSNSSYYYDGAMSHIHFCDGTQYAASDFGQTDATTGEWIIKTSPSVTYGNNGFFILKDGNSVTDQSGQGNNWTVGGGTLTKTEDNPSNVFATLNASVKKVSSMSFSNANTTITTSGSQWEGSVTTLAPTKGKWYWEAKYNTGSGIKLDIARWTADLRNMATANNSYLAYHGDGYGYQLNNSGTDYYCSNNSCTTWNSNVNGNSTKIYMVAVDLDNGKMWIGADGTWANKTGTANPVTGDDPLHDFSGKINGEPWLFSMSVEGGSGSHNANFGNGYFGTTAVSSAGTNASNVGIFEYNVPTGYTALCTKGLNSF